MNYLPSKELLNEVLGDEYNDRLVDWFQIEDNYLRTYYDCGGYDYEGRPTGLGIEINIYELAYKCKVWAFANGFIINSGRTTSNDWCTTIYKVLKLHPYIEEISHTWEDTEPEAIFQVCQWILDNRNHYEL